MLFIASHAVNLHGGRHAINTTDGLQLTDTELAQLHAPIRGRLWIIMATCYGAGFDELLAPGRTLTASADADSLAYENLDLGYSYLVHYLINQQLAHADTIESLDLDAAFTVVASRLAKDFPDRLPVQASR